MAKILINGFSAKTGGGRAILDNFLAVLRKTPGSSGDQYHVLTPTHEEYSGFQKNHVHVVAVPSCYRRSRICLPFFYLLYLPRLIRRLGITVILNFGDIVLPLNIAQVYFFDWPYAVYPQSVVWQRMKGADYLLRRLKLWVIRFTLRYATVTIAQTDTMARRLRELYGLKNIVTVPSPVTLESQRSLSAYDLKMPAGRNALLCLANWSPHKNIEILLPLARLLKKRQSSVTVITTLNPAENRAAKCFVDAVAAEKLEDYLVNLGTVERTKVGSLFQACDGLLLPTLLESYGLPLVEAMFNERTVITSDYDFIRDVCRDAAYYFDPLSEESIYDAINAAYSDEVTRQRKIAIGRTLAEGLPLWTKAFNAYQACITKAYKIFN